jgi:hypothetical protein
LAVTFIVGLTLSVTFRTSGVARRPRIVGDIIVWVTIAGVLAIAVFDRIVDLGGGVWVAEVGRPNPTWALLALVAPVLVLRRVMMQRFVTQDTLRGAIAVYLLIAVAFNYAVLALHGLTGDLFFADAQSTTAFMYFSLATITTVGYGDLSAVTELGRLLASAEAFIGQVLLVVVVARLVSLYGLPNRTSRVSDDDRSEVLDG